MADNQNATASADGSATPPGHVDTRPLMVIGAVGIVVLTAFGLGIAQLNLLDFPAPADATGTANYLDDSLIYRERRLALALVARTFITGFSFVVGLALCTMGGLFILKQVSSLTAFNLTLGGGPQTGPAETMTSLSEGLRNTQFAFSSYSPGVLFMLGGVGIVALTQWMTIPIRAVEVFPVGTMPLCAEREGGPHAECPEVLTTKVAPRASAPEAAAAVSTRFPGDPETPEGEE